MKKNNVVQFLDEASKAYYAGSPIIPDAVFDSLAESANYNKVGSSQRENAEKHYSRMYSLQKHYEGKTKPPFTAADYKISVSPKIDGAAISLLYCNGVLTRVLTRGDGIEGLSVTDKFLESNIVPKTLSRDIVPSVLQVTGELAAKSSVENSRNFAAGSLGLNSVEEFCKRDLTFFAYGVYPCIEETFTKDMSLLEYLGFHTVNGMLANSQSFPKDGTVVRVDNNKLFTELGYTAKHPRGAYAIKENLEGVPSKIIAVEWNTGKTGKVTPVALIEPIELDGATVSRVTLNNPGFIRALDLSIGDEVYVVRSGGIIPCITGKVE